MATNKALAVNRIHRQPFFGEVPGAKARLVAVVVQALERVQRTKGDVPAATTQLAHKVLQHFAVYISRHGCLPAQITMQPHHWRELRKVGRWAGMATQKRGEGRRLLGVQVAFD